MGMRVYLDDETKAAYWRAGDDLYHLLGPTDPDSCMMCFAAEKGNYWAPPKRLFDVDAY